MTRPRDFERFQRVQIFETIADVAEEVDINQVEREKCAEETNEVVEVAIDSGASKSAWPRSHRGVERVRKDTGVKLSAANGTAIAVDGEATLRWSVGGKRRCMKFLDADVNARWGLPLRSLTQVTRS